MVVLQLASDVDPVYRKRIRTFRQEGYAFGAFAQFRDRFSQCLAKLDLHIGPLCSGALYQTPVKGASLPCNVKAWDFGIGLATLV